MIDTKALLEQFGLQADRLNEAFASDNTGALAWVKLVKDEGQPAEIIKVNFSSEIYCADNLIHEGSASKQILKLYNDLKQLCETKISEAIRSSGKDSAIGELKDLYGEWTVTTTDNPIVFSTFQYHCAVNLKLA